MLNTLLINVHHRCWFLADPILGSRYVLLMTRGSLHLPCILYLYLQAIPSHFPLFNFFHRCLSSVIQNMSCKMQKSQKHHKEHYKEHYNSDTEHWNKGDTKYQQFVMFTFRAFCDVILPLVLIPYEVNYLSLKETPIISVSSLRVSFVDLQNSVGNNRT